jgi:arylsulfatase A-like enzyme
MELRDDTLILLVSDNGASQEGLRDGTANTDRYRNYFPDTVEEMLGKLDELGSPSTDPHYPMGWAMAGNSPLKRWKQDTHSGGNTDPLIISWPAKIKDVGTIRKQYHHLVDVVPTLLEVTDLPAPTSVNGVKQMDLPGVSMAYTFDNADASTRKESAVLRDARQPCDLVRRLDRGYVAQERGHPGTTTSGSCTTQKSTSRRPTTWPRRCLRS